MFKCQIEILKICYWQINAFKVQIKKRQKRIEKTTGFKLNHRLIVPLFMCRVQSARNWKSELNKKYFQKTLRAVIKHCQEI